MRNKILGLVLALASASAHADEFKMPTAHEVCTSRAELIRVFAQKRDAGELKMTSLDLVEQMKQKHPYFDRDGSAVKMIDLIYENKTITPGEFADATYTGCMKGWKISEDKNKAKAKSD